MDEQEQIPVENFVEIQTMSAEEAAKTWAVQHKINVDAVERLFEEGYNSLEAIRLIEADDLSKSKISKGQRKLIIHSVRKLNNALAGQTGDTAQYPSVASASSVQQQDNEQAENNEPTVQMNSLAASQKQLANQTATGRNQLASQMVTATGSSQPASQAATGSSQLASQTATGSSQPAYQTGSGNSQPPHQTVTGNSHISQQGSPAEDPYLQALRFHQLHSGQSILQNSQSVNAGTLNSSGMNNGALFQNGQIISGNMNVPTIESWKDPQIYLSRAALGKSSPSHYDITDFVTGMVEEEVVVGGNGSHQVVLKSGPKKPKLENVTLAQWCVANNAILYKLVSESKLNTNNMLDYISYSTKVCELVQRFTLVSVLLYDRNYRQLQAQNGFRWGTDVPHLQNVHLIPRIPRPNGNQTQTGGPSQPSKPHQNPGPLTLDGRVICKLFNTKAGCHYKECRYVHQCSYNECHQVHSATTHYQGKN